MSITSAAPLCLSLGDRVPETGALAASAPRRGGGLFLRRACVIGRLAGFRRWYLSRGFAWFIVFSIVVRLVHRREDVAPRLRVWMSMRGVQRLVSLGA